MASLSKTANSPRASYRGERMTVAILVPVYDEASRLVPTLESLRAHAADFGSVTVFLVDDGSHVPVHLGDLPPPNARFRIVLARHAVNLGQGAALETARQLALREPADVFVTMDSDGQHRAEDAVVMARAVRAGADVVFGDRWRGGSSVPLPRRALLVAARLFERLLTGLRLADAHNGLRAFSRRAILSVSLRQNRMAHATEITQRVARARGLSVVEVPVVLRYSEGTLRKGQRSLGALVILRDLLGLYLFGEAE
jgi:glycosyltransferase involved in cell wall biosynthesis